MDNTALADELQNPWQNNHTDSERGPLPDWCLGLLQRAAAALRTPAPAPATVGGDVVGGVTQADRDSATTLANEIFLAMGKGMTEFEAEAYLAGNYDSTSIVQAFAAHRIAALQAQPTASTDGPPVLSDDCEGELSTKPILQLIRENASTAQPDDLERLLGRITCTAETSARVMRDAKNTGGWWGAENTAKNFDIIAKQTDDLRAALAALQAQPTASTAQPVSGDPFDPETDGTDCPSCGGQNTSCPDGCGRDPETGELNGTRLETAQPDEVVEAMARAISEAGDCPRESNQTVAGAWWWDTRYDHPGNEFAHECRANDIKLARAALAAMQQQAPVAEDVAKAIEPVRPWYESDEHPPRELAAIVADIVSDLQSDRAECLRKSMLSDDQVKHMVNRFLMWKLPDNFNPDGGVSFEPEYNVEYNAKQGLPPQRHEPSGTNLLDYTQAEAMVRHMLDGLTQPQPDAAVAVEPVTLNECPPGLFMFDGTLCFKSEYTTTLENPRRYQVDAYCVESGEYFHGGAKSSTERGNLMVEPIDAAAIRAGWQQS